jgi:hypothetical protein
VTATLEFLCTKGDITLNTEILNTLFSEPELASILSVRLYGEEIRNIKENMCEVYLS